MWPTPMAGVAVSDGAVVRVGVVEKDGVAVMAWVGPLAQHWSEASSVA